MARKTRETPETERPGTEEEVRQIAEIAAGGREVEVTLAGKAVKAWWQHPGFAETGQQGAAGLAAVIEAEQNGFIQAQFVGREQPEGKADGKNARFVLAQEYVKPRSVQVRINGAPKEPRRDFNLADNSIFFVRSALPQAGDRLEVAYEYYNPDLYEAYARNARVLVALWLGLREADDHSRRWFDGYDEVDRRRVHRGAFAGIKVLAPDELTGLLNAAFEETISEDEVPNLPGPSSGDGGSDTPSGTTSAPTTAEC